MVSRIWQEFYCSRDGGGCGGFILLKINRRLNCVVDVVCPQCGSKHQRRIKNGSVVKTGMRGETSVEEILPTTGAYLDTPFTEMMICGEGQGSAVVITNPDTQIIKDTWLGVMLSLDKEAVA